jgi:purine-binding chemotaxis protein CheW
LDVEDDKLPKEKKLSLLRVLIDELEVSFTMDRHVDVVSDKKSITNSMMDDFVPSTNTTYIKQTMGYRNSSVSIIFLEKIWFDLNNSVSRQNVIDPVGEHSDTEDDTIKASYREYIYAQIYDYHFIVDIENVLEIIEGYDVTRIHDSKNFVRGLINLRGQVIGCVDISSELGREKLIIDERNKYIVLNHDIYDFALCVSDVIGIRSYSPASFIPAVNVLSEEMSSLFSGVSEQESNTLLILSTDSIINSPKLANYKVGAHG